MTRTRRALAACSLLAAGATAAALLSPPPALAEDHRGDRDDDRRSVRFATFNASLNRTTAGALEADLSQPVATPSTPARQHIATVAEIIQRTRPDILLINEFDFDVDHDSLRLFQDNYLSVGQGGAAPIEYPYAYTAPSNTGIASGFDLDNNGSVGGPNDAFGFGFFPGQFGMAVYSMHPIKTSQIRTFQTFLWKDMPGALLPDDPRTATPADWYSPAELDVFRLSSKSHWDVPIQVGKKTVHFLVSHPTPPVFDDPPTFPAGVDFNGRRNHDEIRFWADYVRPGRSGYVYDDDGRRGGLRPGAFFVIAGDQNSDPFDGDSIPGSAQQLLDNPRVNAKSAPSSEGAVEAARLQGRANTTHEGDPRFDTADFSDSAPGNLRVDYVLPSKALRITDSAVFWPELDEDLSRLTGVFSFDQLRAFPGSSGFPSSDHRLVWVDVRVPAYRR